MNDKPQLEMPVLYSMGYWRSSDESDLPDPAWFVEEYWDPAEKNAVVDYVEACGPMPYAAAGVSWCRFCCGDSPPGSSDVSDGHFIFPTGFIHYVRAHNVKPPGEFMERVRAGKPGPIPLHYSINNHWWLQQKGSHPEKSSILIPDHEVRLILIPQPSPLPLVERLKYLRGFPAIASLNLSMVKAKLENGEDFLAHENIYLSRILKSEEEFLAMGFAWRQENRNT